MGKRHESSRSVTDADLQAALAMRDEADIYTEAALSAQQWQAVAMLAAGQRVAEVADALGVARETVSRWRSSPVFTAAYNVTVREMHAETVGDLRSAAGEAVAVLRGLLGAESERVRLSAAVGVLRLVAEMAGGSESLPVTPAAVAEAEVERRRLAAYAELLRL